MKNYIINSLLLSGFILLFASCNKDPQVQIIEADTPKLPTADFDYKAIESGPIPIQLFLDGNLFNFGSTTQNPKLTNAGATLGRVLFYDKNLSKNNSISCATCHKQELAFSDNTKLSQGFAGKYGNRNTMPILNSVANNRMFWDSRAGTVKDMTLNPVQNHIEMGMEDMLYLEKKLRSLGYYQDLFLKAYGSNSITSERISDALAQFVCSINSTNSKYDQYLKTGNLSIFTEQEKLGLNLFNSDRTKCASCHGGPNLTVASNLTGYYNETLGSANIGLDVNYADKGFEGGKFKIPSLRNIELTAPYMHDGRFATLEEVVEHYNSGIQPNKSLDPKFIGSNGSPIKMNLSLFEKKALIAFLKTFTDQQMIKEKRFSNPFRS